MPRYKDGFYVVTAHKVKYWYSFTDYKDCWGPDGSVEIGLHEAVQVARKCIAVGKEDQCPTENVDIDHEFLLQGYEPEGDRMPVDDQPDSTDENPSCHRLFREIFLQQVSERVYDEKTQKNPFTYRYFVIGTVNTLIPRIGKTLDESEVESLMDDPSVTVTIHEGK